MGSPFSDRDPIPGGLMRGPLAFWIDMTKINVRTGMPGVRLPKEQFAQRVRERFYDPAFAPLSAEIARALVQAVKQSRAGELRQPDAGLQPSRPK